LFLNSVFPPASLINQTKVDSGRPGETVITYGKRFGLISVLLIVVTIFASPRDNG